MEKWRSGGAEGWRAWGIGVSRLIASLWEPEGESAEREFKPGALLIGFRGGLGFNLDHASWLRAGPAWVPTMTS